MNCEKVQSLLVSYLHKETTPSERVLIQAHLSTCSACQEHLSRFADVAGQIRPVLQRRAAQVAPSPAAWEQLEARLAAETRTAAEQSGTWLSRLAPGVSRRYTFLFSGDTTMQKRFLMAGALAFLAIAVVLISTLTQVTQVSASTVLDRAYQAQTQPLPTQGILHTRYERYFNQNGLPADQVAGTVEDTYFDLGSCNSRKVTTNSKTGVVLDVHSTDGQSVYGGFTDDLNTRGPLIVYRSPIDPAKGDCLKPYRGGDQEMFDQMRSDPKVELVGKETWAGGRSVYVLRSQTPAKMVKDGQPVKAPALTTLYFDTRTFQILGSKQVMTGEAGQTVLVWETRYSVDEILPAGSPVHWDVSDLNGVQIMDDPDGSHRDDGSRG